MQSQLSFCRNNPWRPALPRSLQQPPPPTLRHLKTETELHVQKAAQAADEAWQQTVDGHNGPCVTNPNIPVRLVKMMTAKMWMFLRPLGRADSVHRSSAAFTVV